VYMRICMNIDQLTLALTEGTIDLLKKGSKYCRWDRAGGCCRKLIGQSRISVKTEDLTMKCKIRPGNAAG